MTYLSLQELKDAVKPIYGEASEGGQKWFETNPEPEFEGLLQTLEADSRAIINNQINGQGYERETGRVDTFDTPDKPTIQLAFPVDDVTKVEYSNRPGEFKDLDSSLYTFDDQKIEIKASLIDREYPYINDQNPLTYSSNRATWAGVAERVRVTYDRGYETANVPNDIKEVQKSIIRRMLIHLRQEQNLSNLAPDDVQAFNTRQILTDDIKDRIGGISQTKHKYVMLR